MLGDGVVGRLVEMAIMPCAAVANHLEVDVRLSKIDDSEDSSVSVGGLIFDANLLAEDERL